MNAPVSISEVWVKAASASSALLDVNGFDLAGRVVLGQDSAKDVSNFSTTSWVRLDTLLGASGMGLVGVSAKVSGAAVNVLIGPSTPANSDPAMFTLYPGEKLNVGSVPDELVVQFDFGPAKELVSITPDDDNDISGGPVRSIWVGGAGDLAIKDLKGTSVTLVGVQAGSMLPVYASRVLEASTATSIVGMR